MNKSNLKGIAVALLSIMFFHNTTFGQSTSQIDSIVAPPFQAHSGNFMMALFFLNAEAVNDLLPKGMQAKANPDGMVSATLEMYQTDRIYGIPNYSVAFLVVDVLNYDSENGTPGHFTIWGNIDSQNASTNFNHHFGLPFEFNKSVSYVINGNKHSGVVGSSGKEQIKIEMERDSESPFEGSGIVNMVGKSKTGEILISEVPWLSKGNAGKLLNFEVNPQGSPALELLKGSTPYWSVISIDQIFSYSKPIVSNKVK